MAMSTGIGSFLEDTIQLDRDKTEDISNVQAENSKVEGRSKSDSDNASIVLQVYSGEPRDEYDNTGVIIRGSFKTREVRHLMLRNPARKHVKMKYYITVSNPNLLEMNPSSGFIEPGEHVNITLICQPPTKEEDYKVVEYVTTTFVEDSTEKDREIDKIYFPVIYITQPSQVL